MQRVCLLGGLSWGRVVTGQGGSTLDSATHPHARGHVLKVMCSPWGAGSVLRAPLIGRKTSKVQFQGPEETCHLAQSTVLTVRLSTPTSPEHRLLRPHR